MSQVKVIFWVREGGDGLIFDIACRSVLAGLNPTGAHRSFVMHDLIRKEALDDWDDGLIGKGVWISEFWMTS